MALISCKFKSPQLGMATECLAILPEDAQQPLRSVYLLHGHSDDYSAWTRYTSIERYANERGLAIFMPNGERSFYCDMAQGLPYESFLMKDFIPFTRKMFRISAERRDTFIAGLSMGGYGAFRLALRYPEVFEAAASFSGAMDIAAFANGTLAGNPLQTRLFADPAHLAGSRDDLFALVKALDSAEQKPRLYQECGTEDFLYEENIRFRDTVQKLHFDYTYTERPGTHNWGFWDGCVPKALDFFIQK